MTKSKGLWEEGPTSVFLPFDIYQKTTRKGKKNLTKKNQYERRLYFKTGKIKTPWVLGQEVLWLIFYATKKNLL